MITPACDEALVIVDVQNDFCTGGSLAVPEGERVIPVINHIMPEFALVIATQDWHPADHCSFLEQGGAWPPHCVCDSPGAQLHPGLDQSRIAEVVRKGFAKDRDAYSGFQETGLANKLRERGIRKVFIAGLATDYCVKATALDALKGGFETVVIINAVRAVNVFADDESKALSEIKAAGGELVVRDLS